MKLTITVLATTLLLTALLSAATAETFKVFYTFNFSDGSSPNGDLIRDAAGNFYGTTQFGGPSKNRGVVFKLTPSGHETVLYSFTGSTDGGIPIGRLTRDNADNLYGMTSSGGDPTCSCGTVFKLAKNGSLKVLHSFKGGKDGAQNQGQPELGLVMVKGDLYGSASFGGVSGCDGSLGCGVIFKVTQAGKETVLYRFAGQADGAFPQDLTSDTAGNIYGATGGSYQHGNGGTLFKLDTTGKLTTLYTFPGGASGNSPRWRLLRSASGVFDGVTQFGGDTTTCALGTAGCGVAFTVNAAGKETVLHTFGKQSRDGEEPSGGLLDVAGKLYGMTFYGGTKNSTCTLGCGVIYRVGGGKYSVLYRFTGAADGWLPTGGLTADGAGHLYGTALLGGSGSNGVVFEIAP
ncbi:MAG TPA: choice-of-anchor tandem repeat GloVer-containing protein [Terriglobales bacterium]|nr:choice-of-anchor tandem repeat GloVer-containing protein [Terriglobales bacterium]